ncbi:branched chain amino acid aminotransferase [soil metagenome]
MTVTRVSVWSGPRNISTALMYSFRQRADTSVVDEPLYAHYLARSGLEHPGREDVLAALDTDGEAVVRDLILGQAPTPVMFYKNMAHHLRGLDWSFLAGLSNVILTRDPTEMIPSLIEQIPEPDIEETGLPVQVELLDAVLDQGEDPIVIDSRLLLEDPPSVLGELCRRLGIEFEESMLTWEAGAVPEDGTWAPHWYEAVHRSTGFAPYSPKDATVPDRLSGLLAQASPLFERLTAYAIGR